LLLSEMPCVVSEQRHGTHVTWLRNKILERNFAHQNESEFALTLYCNIFKGEFKVVRISLSVV